jgi:hypothetical protein
VAPADIRRLGLKQLSRCPNFSLLEGEAISAERRLGGFRLRRPTGETLDDQVLVLAPG